MALNRCFTGIGERGYTDSQWGSPCHGEPLLSYELLCKSGIWWCYWAWVSQKPGVWWVPLLGRVQTTATTVL